MQSSTKLIIIGLAILATITLFSAVGALSPEVEQQQTQLTPY